MPASSSQLARVHMFIEPAVKAESPSQVSLPGSPFCGGAWKTQDCLPVTRSKPRTSPGGCVLIGSRPIAKESRIAMLGMICPPQMMAGVVGLTSERSTGRRSPFVRSIRPLSPKLSIGLPVFGLSATR